MGLAFGICLLILSEIVKAEMLAFMGLGFIVLGMFIKEG